MIDRHPALVVRCRGAGDIVAAIGFARDHGLPRSVKGGGHNIAGLAVGSDESLSNEQEHSTGG